MASFIRCTIASILAWNGGSGDGGDNSGRPKVNGAEIGSQAHALNNEDVIEVAGVDMTFILE